MNDKNNERTMRKRTIGKFCHSKGVNISLGTDCQAFLLSIVLKRVCKISI